MARLFVQPGARLTDTTPAIVSGPMTMCAWFFRTPSLPLGAEIIFAVGGPGGVGYTLGVNLSGGVEARQDNGILSTGSAVTALTTSGVWHHGTAVFSATNSRTIFLDGAVGVTNNTVVGFGAATATVMGGTILGVNEFAGAVAEAAVWDVALTKPQIDQLAAGFSPMLVAPQSLVAFFPLLNTSGSEPNRMVAPVVLGTTGVVSTTAGPRIYPSYV